MQKLNKRQIKEQLFISFPFFLKKSLFILSIFCFLVLSSGCTDINHSDNKSGPLKLQRVLIIPTINQILLKLQRILIVQTIKQSLWKLRIWARLMKPSKKAPLYWNLVLENAFLANNRNRFFQISSQCIRILLQWCLSTLKSILSSQKSLE